MTFLVRLRPDIFYFDGVISFRAMVPFAFRDSNGLEYAACPAHRYFQRGTSFLGCKERCHSEPSGNFPKRFCGKLQQHNFVSAVFATSFPSQWKCVGEKPRSTSFISNGAWKGQESSAGAGSFIGSSFPRSTSVDRQLERRRADGKRDSTETSVTPEKKKIEKVMARNRTDSTRFENDVGRPKFG